MHREVELACVALVWEEEDPGTAQDCKEFLNV
jgi:hypothetical protein